MHTEIVRTVFMRFSSEDEALEYIDNHPDIGNKPRDVIYRGVIYNKDGEYSEEGEVIKLPTKKIGWHVDIVTQCNDEYNQHTSMNVITPEFKMFIHDNSSKEIK